MARVDNTPTRGWRPPHSSDTCDATWWPNLGFCWILWCAVMFSSTQGGACQRMMVRFSPAIIVFFLFFSLSWEIKYIFILFVFYFSILVPILLISYFVFILFIDVFLFCNSIIRLHFLICFILVPILLIFYFIFIPFKEVLFFNLALQLQFIILFYF